MWRGLQLLAQLCHYASGSLAARACLSEACAAPVGFGAVDVNLCSKSQCVKTAGNCNEA